MTAEIQHVSAILIRYWQKEFRRKTSKELAIRRLRWLGEERVKEVRW